MQKLNNMKVKIYNKSNNDLPEYKTPEAAGMDLSAFIGRPIELKPLERALIPTGIHVELPKGYEIQVRPRSGYTFKTGVTVLNSPATIDSDYRGDIGIILINLSNVAVMIENGQRVAQMVVTKHETIEWDEVKSKDDLNDSERGNGGFGSTGV